jgi:hypothetical protein
VQSPASTGTRCSLRWRSWLFGFFRKTRSISNQTVWTSRVHDLYPKTLRARLSPVVCTIDPVEILQQTSFGAVAEEPHFGRAAERLHISGPSLSQPISNLEREVGAQLLGPRPDTST